MKVWVGCIACYNAGMLIGRWYDADQAGEVTSLMIHQAIPSKAEILAAAHGELWCFDVGDAPHPSLAREMPPDEASKIADVIAYVERHGYDSEAYGAYVDNLGIEFGEDLDGFEDAYCGVWKSREDYAITLAEDIGAIDPDATWPNGCVDWERAARELFFDYWDAPTGLGIHVFRSI